MKNRNSTVKILWAIDPYESGNKLRNRAVQVVRALSKEKQAEIQPVYVLIPDRIDLVASAEHLLWVNEYKAGAEKLMAKKLKGQKLPGLNSPKILVNKDGSVRAGIDVLTGYAVEFGADAIVVSSHSRKGIARFFMGSFAETLLLYSKVPVIVVNPSTESRTGIKRILFPTDFSEECRETFENTVSFSRKYGAKIKLYHQMINPVEPIIYSGVYSPAHDKFGLDPESLKRDRKYKSQLAKEWVNWAKSLGAKVEHEVSIKRKDVPDSILAAAKKDKSDLVVMTNKTGRIISALLGSYTRSIVRASKVPVWVAHASKEGGSPQGPVLPIESAGFIRTHPAQGQ